jgi:hypothetical protein
MRRSSEARQMRPPSIWEAAENSHPNILQGIKVFLVMMPIFQHVPIGWQTLFVTILPDRAGKFCNFNNSSAYCLSRL